MAKNGDNSLFVGAESVDKNNLYTPLYFLKI